jgi:hypothetical protein
MALEMTLLIQNTAKAYGKDGLKKNVMVTNLLLTVKDWCKENGTDEEGIRSLLEKNTSC